MAFSLLMGCSDGGPEPVVPATVKPRTYDPPVKFADSAAHPITDGPGWNVRLDGSTAYAASDEEVKAVDVVTGRELWSVTPRDERREDTDRAGDAVSNLSFGQVDGQRALIVVFGVAPSRIEVAAVVPGTGKRLSTTTVERPAGQEKSDPVLAGVGGATAVIRLGDDSDAMSLGVGLDTHRTVWTAKGFAARFVDLGTAVGLVDAGGKGAGGITVKGLGASDGKTDWTYGTPGLDRATLTSEGVDTGLFTADVDPHEPGEPDTTAVLASSTGRPPAGWGAGRTDGLSALTCLSDRAGTTVCTSTATKDGRKRVFGLDTPTQNELWSIEEGGRSALPLPEVTAVHDGAVYGDTEDGPVVLDARTGEQKVTDSGLGPGESPFAVSGYTGLVRSATKGIEAHRAVG